MTEKSIHITLASKKDQDAALNLIFNEQKDTVLNLFKQKFNSINLITDNLIIATNRNNSKIHASALILPNAGKISTIYFSNGGEHDAALDTIMKFAPTHASKNKSTVIQATLYQAEKLKIKSLEKCGFKSLGKLLFLSRNTKSIKKICTPEIMIKNLSSTSQKVVLEIFQRTIQKSLDFPLLNKLRSPKDLLSGYSSMSSNDKSLWRIAYMNSCPVGIVIANKPPKEKNIDLHYLGVAPEARQKKVASTLLNSLLEDCHSIDCEHIFLTCDARNIFARRLYEKYKFSVKSEKLAFALPLIT